MGIRDLKVTIIIDSAGTLDMVKTAQKVRDTLHETARIFLEQCLIEMHLVHTETREFPSVHGMGEDVVEANLFIAGIPTLGISDTDVIIGITERIVVDTSTFWMPMIGADTLLSGAHYENILLVSFHDMPATVCVGAVAHELGHAFGAAHTDPGVYSIMTPDYTPFMEEERPLPFDDENRLIITENRFKIFNPL